MKKYYFYKIARFADFGDTDSNPPKIQLDPYSKDGFNTIEEANHYAKNGNKLIGPYILLDCHNKTVVYSFPPP